MGNRNSPSEKIIRILKKIHITAKYIPFDFTSGNNYARFELATTTQTAEGLEKAINSHFTQINGCFAQIRTIGTETIKENRSYKYILEIVPDEKMKFSASRKEEETQKLLDRLPKELENYLKMNRSKC